MSETTEKYVATVEALKVDMTAFVDAATAGTEGRGSKAKALEARKISTKIAATLKDFRAVSVQNDKEKSAK